MPPLVELEEYLTNLASDAPAPGGGSAALVVAATACALVGMVARITLAAKKHREVHAAAKTLVERSDALRSKMLAMRLRDETAFEAVVAARGIPDAMERALTGAAQAPLDAAAQVLDVLGLCEAALELRNTHLASDVACAAEFAHGALRACAYNVRINHTFMKHAATAARQREELSATVALGERTYAKIRDGLSADLTL